jgi:hypothetical protein
MDEVTALEDFYHLTDNGFAASFAWEYWNSSLW